MITHHTIKGTSIRSDQLQTQPRHITQAKSQFKYNEKQKGKTLTATQRLAMSLHSR